MRHTGRGISRSRSGRALVLLLLAASLGLSCFLSSEYLDRFFRGHVHMQVLVDSDLNEYSPVAVQLLVIYDKKLLPTLQAMTAQEWFAKREELLQKYSVGHKVDAWLWEWVPGQVVVEQVLPYRVGVQGSIIFANYYSAGDHRATVDPFKPFLLHLMASDFSVEALN